MVSALARSPGRILGVSRRQHHPVSLLTIGLAFLSIYGILTTLYMLSSHSIMNALERQREQRLKMQSLWHKDKETTVLRDAVKEEHPFKEALVRAFTDDSILLDQSSNHQLKVQVPGSVLPLSKTQQNENNIEEAEEDDEPPKQQDDIIIPNLANADQPKAIRVAPQPGDLFVDDDAANQEGGKSDASGLGNTNEFGLVTVADKSKKNEVNLKPDKELKGEHQSKVVIRNQTAANTAKESSTDSRNQRYVLKAYLEPPFTREQLATKPLPRRNTQSSDLQQIQYPQVNSCAQIQSQWPVDNSPVDIDPFLPWIHDVFPSHDGTVVHFVAQNRRRCHTGKDFVDLMEFMEPQVSLMQPISLKRVVDDSSQKTRYKLTSHEQADPDGVETRFICHFHPTEEQTLSAYPFNYEYVNYHKGRRFDSKMFDKTGKNNAKLWDSQIIFHCPVPTSLQQHIRNGSSVVDDYATIYVDLIPVRTPARFGETFISPARGGPATFNATKEWGTDHLLPSIDSSGRWANIPICKPSALTYHVLDDAIMSSIKETDQPLKVDLQTIPETNISRGVTRSIQYNDTSVLKKPHSLVACTWASASFHIRGDDTAIDDGERRLLEWITFHLMVGFDHIYIYDNSASKNRSGASLKPVTDLFPPDKVTRIDWPCTICNNNWPSNADPGERSSQYAAETSCRIRFGPLAEWIASFDVDEYFVPMGNMTTLKDVVRQADEKDVKILSFLSARAMPRETHMEPFYDDTRCTKDLVAPCLTPRANATFLETFNCDYAKLPKQDRFRRKGKQVYRPDHVLLHFVHYSTVTTNFPVETKSEVVNELTEAVMLHAKARPPLETLARANCKIGDKNCGGIGRECKDDAPIDSRGESTTVDSDGISYCNCFVNHHIDNHWTPRLEMALRRRDFRIDPA